MNSELLQWVGSSLVERSPKATGRWFDYVPSLCLKSLVNGRLYTGSTNNLERRMYEHNNGQTTYTRSTKPFKLVYKESYNTKLEAIQRERFLKTGKGRGLLKQMLGS